ncbi:hypothetical protein ALO43_200602 [Pseudomonas tremae]|uniref:Glutamine synthetase n=1 Tax=Pseudomonas tremae TaxID=200454 RepID=A0AA40P2G3_9PSED|nr:hypothetical protein ALO43_200602 [Pseudomonas tremae]
MRLFLLRRRLTTGCLLPRVPYSVASALTLQRLHLMFHWDALDMFMAYGSRLLYWRGAGAVACCYWQEIPSVKLSPRVIVQSPHSLVTRARQHCSSTIQMLFLHPIFSGQMGEVRGTLLFLQAGSGTSKAATFPLQKRA